MKPIVDSLKVLGESTKTFESLRDNLFAPQKTKFNSQICTTREQSGMLIALGLKKETADMGFRELGNGWREYFVNGDVYNLSPSKIFPAWSLHRLIEMVQYVCSRITMVDSWVRIENRFMPYIDYRCDMFDNTYDNLIDCIEWLIKEGYFNKEYLEE